MYAGNCGEHNNISLQRYQANEELIHTLIRSLFYWDKLFFFTLFFYNDAWKQLYFLQKWSHYREFSEGETKQKLGSFRYFFCDRRWRKMGRINENHMFLHLGMESLAYVDPYLIYNAENNKETNILKEIAQVQNFFNLTTLSASSN